MKALLSHAPGGPATLTLDIVADPIPGPGQVLVEVHAVGVNYPDALVIEDRYQIKPPRPFAPGGEVAGVVRARGEGATRFAVGQRVLAAPGWGGLAELIAIDEAKCAAVPDSMPFDEAAALLVTYGTSYHALVDRGRLAVGETLLVLGAAGGIGVAAIELGRALGATVVAAASTPEKVAFAQSVGAHRGVVYPADLSDAGAQREFATRLKEACGGGADVVVDPIGGPYAEPALRALNWDGRHLVIGFTAGIPRPPLNLVLLKSVNVLGVIWGAWLARDPGAFQAQVDALLALYADGRIRPRISARYPLENAAGAIRCVGERQALGKIVVTVGASR
jgi:NADPH2:quinone reductase